MKISPRGMMQAVSIPIALACTACGAAEPREQEQDLLATDSEQTREGVTVSADQRELAELAINTLAAHLSVGPGEITLQSISPVDWPDSSLGCPQPDMGYLQVITPGHKALLLHQGRVYQVHMAGKRAFVCTEKNVDAPKMPKLTLSAEHIGKLAAADLACSWVT